MTLAAKYSEANVLNSVGLWLADRLRAAGYVLYWHRPDAVQLPDGTWWYNYYAQAATYLANPAFATPFTASRGLVSLYEGWPANPTYLVRPTTDGSVPQQDAIVVPALALSLAEAVPHRNAQLGDRTTKVRTRHLVIEGAVREEEHRWFKDQLALWFDPETVLDIKDHDAGDLADVGLVRVAQAGVASAKRALRPDAATYQVVLNALLEYVA
jgi:hypothetical protein